VARWGCSLSVIDRHLYIYGGRGADQCCRASFYSVSLPSLETAYVKTVRFPRAREGHTCVVYDDSLYLYGGCEGGGSEEEVYFADLNVFELRGKKWSNVRVGGDVPVGRENHACGIVEDRMLVYGGNTAAGLSDEVFTFSFVGNSWSQHTPKSLSPGRRESSGCCVLGTSMYLFGGNVNGDRRRNDLCSDDFFTLSLVQGDIICEKVKTIGALPPARLSHTLSALNEHTLALYGGEKDGSMLQDLWVYYLEYCCWVQVQVQTQAPLPVRMAHCAVAYNGKLLLFGGMGSDNIARSELCAVTIGNNPFADPPSADIDFNPPPKVADECVKCRHKLSACSLLDAYEGFKFPNFSFCSRLTPPTPLIHEVSDSLVDPYLSLFSLICGLGPGYFKLDLINSESGEPFSASENSDSSCSTLDAPTGKVLLLQSNVALSSESAVQLMTGKWLGWLAAVGNVAMMLSRNEGVLTIVAVRMGEERVESYRLVFDKDGSCLYPEYTLYHQTLNIVAKLSGMQPNRLLSHPTGSSLYMHTRAFIERSKVIVCPAAHQSLSLSEFLQFAWQHSPVPQEYSVSGLTVTPKFLPETATVCDRTAHYERWIHKGAGPSSTAVYYENRLVYLWMEDGKRRADTGSHLVVELLSRKYVLTDLVASRQTLSLARAWELLTF